MMHPERKKKPEKPTKQVSVVVLGENGDAPILPDHYILVDHLRLVRPYHFDFKCNVKGRWDGQLLLDVFCKEFPALPREYYETAFNAGRIHVQGYPAWTLDRPLWSGLCIRHFIHRHEPPVLAGDIQVVCETADYVAVSKPACMPVHAAGQYRKNTLMGVLQSQRPDLQPLFPTHRLDKPVSGLLVLARNSAAATRIRVHLENRTCQKVYVARVMGVFPETPQPLIVTAPIFWDAATNHASTRPDSHDAAAAAAAAAPTIADSATLNPAAAAPTAATTDTTATNPATAATTTPNNNSSSSSSSSGIATVPAGATSTQKASGALSPDASKDAETHFTRLSVADDALTSVVECRPQTGRSHQIRVHLQHMGHPIANDTQYGGAYGLPLFFTRRLDVAAAASSTVACAEGATEDCQTAPVATAVKETPVAASTAEAAAAAAASKGKTGPEPCSHASDEHAQEHQLAQHPFGQARPATSFPETVSQESTILEHRPLPGTRTDTPHESSMTRRGALLQEQLTQHTGGGVSAVAAAGSRISVSAIATDPRVAALAGAVAAQYQRLYTSERYRVTAEELDPVCPHCPCLVPEGYPIDLEPMWLHAFSYSSAEWHFQTELPVWAAPGFAALPSRGVSL
ncbi:MAG: hypothetical protein WDW36_003075 [Sanguina aurantia]